MIRDAARSLMRSLGSVEGFLQSPLVFLVLGVGVGYATPHTKILTFVIVLPAGLLLGRLAWRQPILALTVVAVGMSFQTLALAWLHEHGVPADTLTLASYWKEWLLLVVAVRAWYERARSDRAADRVDMLALAFLAVIAVYIVLPVGPELRVRYIAARADAAFVVLFLAARWLPYRPIDRLRLERAIIATGVIVAGLGFWNYFDETGWTRWVYSTGLPAYIYDVLESSSYLPVLRTQFGSTEVIRTGSIFLDPIALAYLLLVVLGVVGSRVLRGAAGRLEVAAGVACAVCTCLTFTRSAIALLPLLGLVLAVATGRLNRNVGVFMTGALALVLIASVLQVGAQVQSGFDTSDPRTSEHVDALGESTGRVLGTPFGSGLGTASGVANRFQVAGRLKTSEDFYLQLGVEVGIAGAVLFIAFAFALWQALWRRARDDVDSPAVGAAAGFACVAVGGVVLHTFANMPVTWPLFVLAGMAVNTAGRGRTDPNAVTPARSTLRATHAP